MESTTEEVPLRKKRLLLGGITGGFLLIALVIFLLWRVIWRFEVYTDDAYVNGNQIIVTSQIPGFITSVSVEDTNLVKQGRVLVELDTLNAKISLEKAQSSLAETVRTVVQMFETAGSLKAKKEKIKAELVRAGLDYEHRKELIKAGGVSQEDFEHSEATFIATFAQLLSITHEMRKALAMVENTTVETHPLVQQAKDVLRQAYIHLQRCQIRSPATGMIAMKKAQVGEAIDPATPLLFLIPFDQMWVDANFKEVQLKNVRIGQPVTLTADLYGSGVVYHGKVVGISAGTGSVLSVLPPQNATGNWIKIVQRLPVRILLDPKEIKKYPLRLGLSMKVTIDIHHTEGKMIPSPPPPQPLFTTDVFAKQEEGAEELIAKILRENTSFSFVIGEDNNARD